MPRSESALVSGRSGCVLMVISMRASINFVAGQSSKIGRYEVPRENPCRDRDRNDNR